MLNILTAQYMQFNALLMGEDAPALPAPAGRAVADHTAHTPDARLQYAARPPVPDAGGAKRMKKNREPRTKERRTEHRDTHRTCTGPPR